MSEKGKKGGLWRLWIGVTLAFMILIAAWTTLITVAQNNKVQKVEVEEAQP